MIVAYKIFKNLYRVRNPRGIVKDVWIKFGKIAPAKNLFDILTETEMQEVQKLLDKEK